MSFIVHDVLKSREEAQEIHKIVNFGLIKFWIGLITFPGQQGIPRK